MSNLPIEPYSTNDEEELVRIAAYDTKLKEDGTAIVQTPVYWEDLGKKGKKEAVRRIKLFLYKKILDGTATSNEMQRYEILKNNIVNLKNGFTLPN